MTIKHQTHVTRSGSLAGGLRLPHLRFQDASLAGKMMHGPLDQGANSAAKPANIATRSRLGSPQVNITRREFAIGTGTLALTGAAVLAGFTSLGLSGPALAQDPSPAELMKAGPLGEMVLGDEKAPV